MSAKIIGIVLAVIAGVVVLALVVGGMVSLGKGSFAVSASCTPSGMSVLCGGFTSEAGVSDVKYSVDFGDGTPRQYDTGFASVQHTYQTAGTYSITVYADSPDGRSGSWSQTFTFPAG